jgi:hypothetical protein
MLLLAALLACAARLPAAESLGLIAVRGPVWADGARIQGGPVRAGQTIRTDAQATARLELRSLEVVLLNHSELRLEPAGPVLSGGAAEFSCRRQRLTVGVARLRAQLAPETALTATAGQHGQARIEVRRGAAVILDPRGPALASMTAGQTLEFGLAARQRAGAAPTRGRSGGQAPEILGRRSGGHAPGFPAASAAGAAPEAAPETEYVVVPAGPASGPVSGRSD